MWCSKTNFDLFFDEVIVFELPENNSNLISYIVHNYFEWFEKFCLSCFDLIVDPQIMEKVKLIRSNKYWYEHFLVNCNIISSLSFKYNEKKEIIKLLFMETLITISVVSCFERHYTILKLDTVKLVSEICFGFKHVTMDFLLDYFVRDLPFVQLKP